MYSRNFGKEPDRERSPKIGKRKIFGGIDPPNKAVYELSTETALPPLARSPVATDINNHLMK
ncbi:MAG: hypothetical protein ACRD8Z_28235 [Nitrososphaeraceae archaeon]